MASSPRRILLLPIVALALLGLAACGSSSKSATTTTTSPTSSAAPVVGKSSSVVVNRQTFELLQASGITLTPVAPATGKTTIVFPISGGQMAVATFAGTIQDTGGVTVSHDGKSVTLTSFTIDTSTKQVTALLAGTRVPVFDMNLSTLVRMTGVHGTAIGTGIKLTLTEQSASELNSALGVSAFKAGQLFGIATLTVATTAP